MEHTSCTVADSAGQFACVASLNPGRRGVSFFYKQTNKNPNSEKIKDLPQLRQDPGFEPRPL